MNTRERIYLECLNLLATKEDSFSLSKLSSLLGIKKQSLYSFFSSKEELINSTLKYYSDKLKIVSFDIDFSLDTSQAVLLLIKHYVLLFFQGENRAYFSYIFTLKENSRKDILNLEDIKYTIENQLFFLLSELVEKKKHKFLISLESLSHILMLMVLDLIQMTNDEESLNFELENLKVDLEELLH